MQICFNLLKKASIIDFLFAWQSEYKTYIAHSYQMSLNANYTSKAFSLGYDFFNFYHSQRAI